MMGAMPDLTPTARITLTSARRSWPSDWARFCRSFPALAIPANSASPFYSLSDAAVQRLSRASRNAPSFFEGADAESERAFTNLCQQHFAVGTWQGKPVNFGPLLPPLPDLTSAEMQAAGFSSAQQIQARRGMKVQPENRLRTKGIPGWLLTEPAFLEEIAELRGRWNALSDDERPSFPLARPLTLPTALPSSGQVSPATGEFMDQLRVVLDRWGLLSMVTWDLPDPHRPLLPNPLPAGATAVPGHGIHLVLPLHYPLQGDDDLIRQVVRWQQQA